MGFYQAASPFQWFDKEEEEEEEEPCWKLGLRTGFGNSKQGIEQADTT